MIPLLFTILALKTNIIRIGGNTGPFSLSLSQMFFWFIVVTSSFMYIWIITGEFPLIFGSTLTLLSVSSFTTVGSRIVSLTAKKKGGVTPISSSFLNDILQDDFGYSVHRVQMFVWTIIVGLIFISSVIELQQIPQLHTGLLTLMGVSSGAYVGLKAWKIFQ
jgi:hypothetical protein